MKKKKLWIFNHYATNTFFDSGGRHYAYAKYLLSKGYKVTIFCANTVHGSTKQIEVEGDFVEKELDGINYVFVSCPQYCGNGKKRISNMLKYYFCLKKICKFFDKPDLIIGSQVHPLACLSAIQLSRRIGCKCITEYRDLWPVSIVEYSKFTNRNILIQLLYKLEKKLYLSSDGIIFTMPGGIDYLREKKYSNKIDFKYVYYLNNGVDLDKFNFNKINIKIDDPDLSSDKFKIMYTGSLRTVNGIEFILEILSKLDFEFECLLYGNTNDEQALIENIKKRNLESKVKFKGVTDKNNIPYILSKSDVNIIYWQSDEITKRGISANKLFDYMAAGKPIISNNIEKYDFIEKNECGFSYSVHNVDEYVEAIKKIYSLSNKEREFMEKRVLELSCQYDYKILTNYLDHIIEEVIGRK